MGDDDFVFHCHFCVREMSIQHEVSFPRLYISGQYYLPVNPGTLSQPGPSQETRGDFSV